MGVHLISMEKVSPRVLQNTNRTSAHFLYQKPNIVKIEKPVIFIKAEALNEHWD